MHPKSLIVCENSEALAAQAADLIIRLAGEAVNQYGRFMFALAGGSTPERAYCLLSQRERVNRAPWADTHVFFGDERFVPHEDPRSNFAMAQRALLAAVPVPPDHVHPVPTKLDSAAESATAYSDELARWFPDCERTPPRFDLILLGLGEDGHTASLFPHAPALRITNEWVTWTPPGNLPPPVDRITLTYPALNAGRNVVFLVSGARKAPAVRDVCEGKLLPEQRPAAGVKPQAGALTWLIDADAAQLLNTGVLITRVRTCVGDRRDASPK
jgi:6-phosphogluconolactonase